ncbi:MAG: hypothetical protein ACLTSX_00950 [Collinsella sp.]
MVRSGGAAPTASTSRLAERVRKYGRMAEAAPFYPLYACMVHPTKVLAVSHSDGAYCTHFERGNRNEHYKEV